MSFSVITFIACVTIPSFAAWFFGYNSKPNKEARKLLEEKAEKEFKQKAAEQEAGRERNRKTVQKREVLEILNEAVSYPQRLRGQSSDHPHVHYDYTDLRRFVERSNHVEFRGEEVLQLKQQVAKQSNLIRDLQGQLKEINKALQLGQPVE